MLTIIGWIGSLMFCFCALPQAIRIWRTHSVSDISWSFLIMWLIGEIFTTFYVIVSNIISKEFQYPLLLNYFVSTIILLYLIYGKWKYTK